MVDAEWLPFEELIVIVHARFRAVSVGRAESIVRKALDSGDVREEPRIAAYDGHLDYILRPSAVRHPGRYSVTDFLDWLALNPPPQAESVTTQPNPPKPREQTKRELARRAIKVCWPGGVPDTVPLDKSFCTRLRAACKVRKIAWLDNISDKTILRAARDLGRK
jgi:hypothetical protein